MICPVNFASEMSGFEASGRRGRLAAGALLKDGNRKSRAYSMSSRARCNELGCSLELMELILAEWSVAALAPRGLAAGLPFQATAHAGHLY